MVHSADFYQLYQTTYENYTELYGKHVCVFLQKGSFYELYGIYDPEKDCYENTVKEVADLLDLQLKVYPKDVKNTKTGLFGGVPEHTIHKWAGKLCNLGWTCILIDQVKNSVGEITKREVTRVLSPGTHLEQAHSDESMYVLSIYISVMNLSSPPKVGVCAIECSTAQVIHYEQEATGTLQSWHADSSAQFVSTFYPKEVILNWNGGSIFCPEEQDLRIIFEIPQTVPIYITMTDSSIQSSSSTSRGEYISSYIRNESMLDIRSLCGLVNSSQAEYAMYELFMFIEKHDRGIIEMIQIPEKWNPENMMAVLNHAMDQLNIKSANGVSIETLINKCSTAIGKRHFKQLIQTPHSDSAAISKSHEAITWILEQNKDTRYNLEICLKSMCDIARLHRQMSKGNLTHESIYQLAITMESMVLLIRLLEKSPIYNDKLEESIESCISSIKSLTRWDLVMKYNEDIDPFINWLDVSVSSDSEDLYTHIKELRKKADDWLRDFEKKAGISANSLSFKSGDSSRYQVTITKTQHKHFKTNNQAQYENYTYKFMSSSVKVEHAELDTINSKTAIAEELFKKTFARELLNVCITYCKKTQSIWQELEKWLAMADIIITHASVAEKYGFIRPELVESEESIVSIENLRHPLIEIQKSRVKYTTHSITLDEGSSGILLYGINASGKSCLMKAIGIAVVLAQCGLFVPATSMRLRPFKTLATRILNHDNIAQGMSSFTVEMSELREILRVADKHTLVLGDEVCAGTESISGTSIVAATLDHLLEKRTRFVFATHLHDLMKCKVIIENPYLKVFHLHVEYNAEKDMLVYHRTLSPGSGKTYYGLEVAKALHIPIHILNKAHAFRELLLDVSSTKSHWNKNHVVSKCEICNSELHSRLEVHHIQPRENSVGGRNKDGTSLNSIRNLITVCNECHDKHHASEIEIKEVLQTSQGEKREVIKKIIKKKAGVDKYSQEEKDLIYKCIKENIGLSSVLLIVKLSQEYNLVISKKDIEAMMRS